MTAADTARSARAGSAISSSPRTTSARAASSPRTRSATSRAAVTSIGSHSCSHPLRMGHCSWPQLLDEWSRSRAILSDIVGADVRDASVPGGDFAPQVAEAAARAGITRLFTSEPTGDVAPRVWPDARRPLHDPALDDRRHRGGAGRRRLAAVRAPGGRVEREEDDQAARRRALSPDPQAAAPSRQRRAVGGYERRDWGLRLTRAEG